MRKSYRVKKEAEFQKVFTQGKSCANKQFVVYMIEKPKQPHFRVGISVGKKIGNAVSRNRSRRVIRAAYSVLEPSIVGSWDFVFVARSKTSRVKMQNVLEDMKKHFTALGVIDDKNIS